MKNAILSILLLFLGGFASAQGGAIAEMRLTASMGATGTIKFIVGTAGTRMEMQMSVPQMPVAGISMTTITKKSEPGKSYSINDKSKTWSVTRHSPEAASETVEITVLGNEKVGKYNTTHIRAKNNRGEVYEMWNSKEVLQYSDFSQALTSAKYMGSEALQKALVQKSADGFPVKLTYTDKEGTFTSELTRISSETPAPGAFEIPAGYTESKSATTSPSGPATIDPAQIMNMTPAEREKYIEGMKKQYGQ